MYAYLNMDKDIIIDQNKSRLVTTIAKLAAQNKSKAGGT